MEWEGRINSDPEILGGNPVVEGTRISVELVLKRLAQEFPNAEPIYEVSPHKI
jgi:uncharacterized protein (DUF433 family)